MEQHQDLLSDYRQKESLEETRYSGPAPSPRGPRFYQLAVWLLLASLATNVIQVFLASRSVVSVNYQEPDSKYAHISRNRREPYVLLSEYSTTNETVQDKAWMSIDDDLAIVALSDEYARAHDLRLAQRFPWDQTKGLYIIHGIHNLHCLKNIYISLREHRHGKEQSRSWHHISHCLDAIRRQIICDADDTPRATERRPEVVAGLGQYRMCRSWDALEDFAKRHTACYKRPENAEWDGPSKLDRFKHCPEGSGYIVKDDYVPTDKILEGLPAENVEYAE